MGAGDLIQSQQIDSANIVQGGVGSDSRLVLILKSDLAAYTVSGIDAITALTLAANKSAFIFEGVRQSLKPKFERVASDAGTSQFKHTTDFYIFAYDQVSKNNAARIAQGRYVAIYENAKLDGNTIEVCGVEVGLECTAMTRAPQEMGGGIHITLSSPDKEFENKPPRTFDAGTGVYATNRTAIDALSFLPTIGVGGLSVTTYATITPTLLTITGTNFFGAGVNNAVLKMEWINNLTGASTVIPFGAVGGTYAVPSATSITFTNTASQVPVGSYKIKITTTKGAVFSAQNIILT